MSRVLEAIAPTVAWIALAVALAAVLYVWLSTKVIRTLLAKRREFAMRPEQAASDYHSNPFYQFLQGVRAKGTRDPDVDLFIAVLEGDVEHLKQALAEGANVNVTDSELVKRYSVDEKRPKE